MVTKQLFGLSGSIVSVNNKPCALYVKLLDRVTVRVCAVVWELNISVVNNALVIKPNEMTFLKSKDEHFAANFSASFIVCSAVCL